MPLLAKRSLPALTCLMPLYKSPYVFYLIQKNFESPDQILPLYHFEYEYWKLILQFESMENFYEILLKQIHMPGHH